MDHVNFMHEFIRTARPRIPLRHDLLEDGRLLVEMDRVEQLASTAHIRKQEENETKKLFEALEREKHDAEVAKRRQIQLMRNTDDLRNLRSYIITAETARDLVSQLKLQDQTIEKRFEEANAHAQELRAEYKAAEERQRQLELKKHFEAKMLREDLRGQMAIQEMKRAEVIEERMRNGKEILDKLKALDERDRVQAVANAKAKVEMRKEMLEALRQRKEHAKWLHEQEMKATQAHFEKKNTGDELNENIRKNRLLKIQKKQEVAAKIGAKVFATDNAKRKAVTDLIDMFVNERIANEQIAEKEALDKENATRRMLQTESDLFLERKQALKDRQDRINLEIALKRKPLAREEQDRPRGKIRNPVKIEEIKQFMSEKKEMDLERFERDAEERRQLNEAYEKHAEDLGRDVEKAKSDLLASQPIGLLRYLPSSLVRTDYLPDQLRERVREAVRNDPIPILTKKRHQPHMRRHHGDEAQPVKCCKTCPNRTISNVF